MFKVQSLPYASQMTKYCVSCLYVAYEHEVCEENYKRECVINFEKVAFNVTVTVCRQPLVKDCDVDGVEVCRTESESECTTIHEQNQVTTESIRKLLKTILIRLTMMFLTARQYTRSSVLTRQTDIPPPRCAMHGLRRCAR